MRLSWLLALALLSSAVAAEEEKTFGPPSAEKGFELARGKVTSIFIGAAAE